jgi:hypothetical protein
MTLISRHMPTIRELMPTSRGIRLAALAPALLLAGCGTASPGRQGAYAPPITNADVAQSGLRRLNTPPNFHRATCVFLAGRAYTRCYRRNTYTPLNATTFAALITASGLVPDSGTVICPRLIRARIDNPVTWDNCQARANAGSVEFAASAHSIKILRQNAIKPSDRTIAAKLRGTVFELTVVTTHA